ncbi:MAG: hypothetical protein EB078_02010 [Proteobacteria bacterium]|nr:hypothetical protein [Pseudomonadota bacterium]NDC23503.1 hypothetical protein [Pseudomonadota bacterium]NDD03656.1 hypothetical protein [Pseudomonadota bacterium]NDG26097.1 hypothetical protein [Pseudomonadota bacterium]
MTKAMDTYYDILRVSRNASPTEVLAAYHAAKGAITQKSLEERGTLSPSDIEGFLKQIEEAYHTLSDPSRREAYNKLIELAASEPTTPVPPSISPTGLPIPFSGEVLRAFREKHQLSIEEVFRITRIPVRYLKAIEEGVQKDMPARVYLQGFVKNLAHVYKLPPVEAAKLFLEYFDQRFSNK